MSGGEAAPGPADPAEAARAAAARLVAAEAWAEGAAAAAESLAQGAERVLRTPEPARKTALSRALAARWRDGWAAEQGPSAVGAAAPPDAPARPARPELIDPRKTPRRGAGSARGRMALLHAVAHIELNAVDLHWDAVARFAGRVPLPLGYFDDWAGAAAEEAKHFQLLEARLAAHGARYGDLPAHAGMWRAAEATAGDLLARLAVVPMVLEARGLDVTPDMIALFRGAGDAESAAALEVIYAEEVGHVAFGSKWFHFLCGRADRDPRPTFHDLVKTHFDGALRPPFNDEKRAEAGLPLDFYWPLAEQR